MKKSNKCRLKDCNRKIYIKKHELCAAHAMRFYRTGKVGDSKIRKRKIHKAYK